MTQDNPNPPVGSERLEAMTNDRRKGKRPGAGFWFFFCALFVAACVAVIWILGGMVKSGVDNIRSGSDSPAAVEPLPLQAEPLNQPNEDTEPTLNNSAPGNTNGNSSLTQTQVLAADQQKKLPVTIGGTDIYQDEDGVWRNINREPSITASGPKPDPSSPMAGSAAGDINDSGPDFIQSMLSGLFSPESGGMLQGGMGDLGGIVGLISGGLNNAGQSGASPFTGDIFQTLEQLTSLTGNSGGSGGSLFNQLPGGLSAPSQTQQSGLSPNDPIHDIRRRMDIQAGNDRRRIQELKSGQQMNQTSSRIENFEGFERFDPKDAKNITSSWEYFDDPR